MSPYDVYNLTVLQIFDSKMVGFNCYILQQLHHNISNGKSLKSDYVGIFYVYDFR